MKGVLKKTLSMLLVLCVMSTFMPFYVLAAEGDVCEIVETTVGYPTLDAALTTVQNGQTIRLLKDINYSSGISIVDKSITFNLNGFNLDVVSTAIGDTYAENCGLYVEGNSA
ncbi:MAG TPA: hypothetical protein DDZ89_02280, partial [Clostridiales bacterium]|nr:hypothetical protein [Clostridiales bacterium]